MCGFLKQCLLRRRPRRTSLFIKEVPLSNNAFIIRQNKAAHPDCRGFEHWTSSETVWAVYFRMSKPDAIRISLRFRLPERMTQSSFTYSWNDEETPHEITIKDMKGGQYQDVTLGYRGILEEGYVRVNFQGVRRSGAVFAEVTHLLVSHLDQQNEVLFKALEDPSVGRCGPFLRLDFPMPKEAEEQKLDYYYSEVVIPPGQEFVQGILAVAIGFSGGSLAIQVNGPVEHQIVFSVQSEYKKVDERQRASDFKVTLLQEGTGMFGETDSGAVAISALTLIAGETYKFLVHAKPMEAIGATKSTASTSEVKSQGEAQSSREPAGCEPVAESEGAGPVPVPVPVVAQSTSGPQTEYTEYAAWFMKPETEEWQLVARFKKPKVKVHLSGFYSSLKNHDPDQGHLTRKVHFENHWARDTRTLWYEHTDADFTGDAASIERRRDYAAGLITDNGRSFFFLKHCGFFKEWVATEKRFSRDAEGRVPEIQTDNLP